MIELIVRLWHWFIFGRSAKAISASIGSAGSPLVATDTVMAGSMADLAFMLADASARAVPVNVQVAICRRRTLDVSPGVIRIVIECR